MLPTYLVITTCLTSSSLHVNLALLLLVLFPGQNLPRVSMLGRGTARGHLRHAMYWYQCRALLLLQHVTSGAPCRARSSQYLLPEPCHVPSDKAQGHAYSRFNEVPGRGS